MGEKEVLGGEIAFLAVLLEVDWFVFLQGAGPCTWFMN